MDFLKTHKEKLLYLIVGGWNTLFGYGIFVCLHYLFLTLFNYIVILVISYIVSITNAYIGYKLFVFKTRGNILQEYFKFYIVYGGAFVFNLIALPFFVEILLWDIYLAQAIITLATIIGSYTMHKKFSFKGS